MPKEKQNLPLDTGVNIFLDILTILLGIVIIAAASYFFGFNILREPLSGNDAQNVLSYASWLNDFYPNFPLWYPLAGGGASFMLGYPSLYPLSVVLVHRLIGLNLLSSMSVLNFASVILPAIGVFVFVFFRFRLRMAAIFAGLFYLLSPIAYVLISGAGFLAHAYSYIFAVPFLIFFDWFLSSFLKDKGNVVKSASLFLSGVFFVLTTLAHPVSSLGFMVLFVLYALLRGYNLDGFKGVKRGFLIVLVSAVVFYLLSAFWMKPFQDYTAFSNRDITFTADTSSLPPIQLEGVLGLLGKKPGNEYPFPNLSIIPFVWIMAVVGTILGLLVYKKKAFSLGILALVSTILIGTYGIWIFFTDINWFIGSFLVNRYYYTAFAVLVPIMAGLGVWYLADLPKAVALKLIKSKSKMIASAVSLLGFFVSIVISVSLVFVGLTVLNQYSGWYEEDRSWMLHIGEESGIDTRSIWNRPNPVTPCEYPMGHRKRNNLCDMGPIKTHFNIATLVRFCEKSPVGNASEVVCRGGTKTEERGWEPVGEQEVLEFKERCKEENQPDYVYEICLAFSKSPREQLLNWPRPYLPQEESIQNLTTASFSDKNHPYHFISQPNIRIDVTPSLGTWNKEWGVVNRSGTINAYTGQLVLNKSFQSFFMDTMYSKELVNIPVAVDEMAKYFGTEAIINTGNDQTEKFQSQDWERSELNEGGTLWQPPFDTSIYTIEEKSLVLVIGSKEKQAYNQVFKVAAMGGLSYDDAILVEGEPLIDEYSANDLSEYEMVVLHGYDYSSRSRAFNVIQKYIENGGSVFVDTGWQFVAADWGDESSETKLPSVFPVTSVNWGNTAGDWEASKVDPQFSEKVDFDEFSPLMWGDSPWGASYSSSANLQSWASPLITIEDQVVMAYGQQGGGKIVWSGLNYISHARGSENEEEFEFLNNIFSYLLNDTEGHSKIVENYKRTPDRLEVTLADNSTDKTSLYFKEAYYPYWQAYIENGGGREELEIQTAGPRFMLVDLPKSRAGSRVVFEFDPGLSLVIPKLVSVIAFVVLLALIVESVLGLGMGKKLARLLEPVFSRLSGIFKSSHRKIKKEVTSNEEFDY